MGKRKDALSGWHPEDVKAAIRKKGITLSELGQRNNFSDAYIRNALMRPLFQAEQIIARFLQVPAAEIWPERYNENGERDLSGWNAARRAKAELLRQRASRA